MNIVQILGKPLSILVRGSIGGEFILVLFPREEVGELIGKVGQRKFEFVELS